jgi:UDP-N-acetylmuramate dehydrogenase
MNMRETIPQQLMRGELRLHEPMSRHVSWRAGGEAKRFYKPVDLADLCAFVTTVPMDEPILFVGLGSNLLVRDGGFNGTVVVLTSLIGALALDENDASIVVAGAGAASPHVAKFAAKHHLQGAEWLAGVPGTIGGALAMNAGCYGTQMWEQVVDCVTLDRHGKLHTCIPADFEIAYRHVAFVERSALSAECRRLGVGKNAEFFISARLRFQPGDATIALANIKALLAKRMAAQPLDKPNAGSTFRNPPGDYAARLIESCGLKGHTIGGAQVSMKHANFIINVGEASAKNIEALIDYMEDTVEKKTGVKLIREVRIIGDMVGDTV